MSGSSKRRRSAPVAPPVAPVSAPVADTPPADAAPVAPVSCRIVRPHARGDWYASAPVSAFDVIGDDGATVNDAVGSFVRVIGDGADATVSIRFGGRGGAMIAAVPDDGARCAVVVASVRAMRTAPASYRNDARPGAIPSPIVSIAMGIARNVRDGAAVRTTIGRIPASRRVANVPRVAAAASAKFGTCDPFAAPDDAAPVADGGDVTPAA